MRVDILPHVVCLDFTACVSHTMKQPRAVQAPYAKHRVKQAQIHDAEIRRIELELKKGIPAATGFAELPLSKSTLEGLEKHNYKTLTAVQRAALPHALTGRDLLGAAKTGSGKTLCFLVPVLERLFRLRWTRFDGLGALILTPTRELALQIFQELRKVGASHDLSAGLLIGGKAVKEEAATINRMNILVATPGRLLQHMDETPGFDANSLQPQLLPYLPPHLQPYLPPHLLLTGQVLVLDEADRILDLGFAEAVDAILQNLPQQRQTLLFSATQTKSIKDLARLSLSDPEYVAVHAEAETATPLKLQQALAVVEAHHKVDTLWSFIKAHLAAKTIVFFSTCKQVRFFHEAFKKLRPGVPLRALHGGMKQMKRMVVYADFCQAEHMVLFATDIAGRGLDFPAVDWVLQVDCPEDAAAYIHRVGRTARYLAAGRALLLLTPSEAPGMQAALAAAKIPIKTIRVNPAAQQCIGPALAALLSKSVELKEFAQRALVAYVRSLVLAPSKDVFADVSSLPLEQLASSWGLLAAPKMRFLKKVGKKRQAVLELGGAGGLQGTASPPAQELVPAVSEGVQQADTVQARVKGPEGYAAATGSREQPNSRVSKKAKVAAISGGQGKQQEAEAGEGVESEGHARANQLAAAGGVAWEIRSTAVGKAGKDAAQHGKPVVGERAEEDSGDELLTLKHRDVFSGAGDGEGVGGVASSFSSMAVDAGKKKKKLKIKVGRSTGQRMVFDADGVALRPLEALALDGLGPSAASPDADPGDSVYAVRDNPADRFEVAAAAMHRRDAADKAQVREQRQAAKLARKAKLRALVDAGMDGDEGGVRLHTRDEHENISQDGHDPVAENDQGTGDYASSDSDEGLAAPSGHGKRHIDGRVTVGASSGSGDSLRLAKKARNKGIDAMTMMEQEQLALSLLGVNLSRGAPACGRQRDIILVNGLFQPTLMANVNDTIKITLINNLPTNLPQTASGIAIHFHGLSMWDNATWADGTSYVTQCPLQPGSSFTYSFQADESPGTYFWHDHSTMNRANGLQGALILAFPRVTPPIVSPYPPVTAEYTMLLSDWWDMEANAMGMRLNRPLDQARVTNTSGRYQGVPAPDAILINGAGIASDCNLTSLHSGSKPPFDPPMCSATNFSLPPSSDNPWGCTHSSFTVQRGRSYLFRLINAASSQYLTVCFEAHSIMLRAADATPTDDTLEFTNGCVDLNSGQRYDVLLTATARVPSNFWISVHSQYRQGAPSAYAVLRYAAAPANTLPSTPTPQAFVQPWDHYQINNIVTHDGVMGYLDNYDYESYWAMFQHRGIYTTNQLFYGVNASRTVVLNMTSPLLNATGQLRWAMNNIAMPTNPPCVPVMSLVRSNPNWLAANAVPFTNTTRQARATASILQLATYTNTSLNAPVYRSRGQSALLLPAVGMHIIELQYGELVDIVMQNLNSSDLNGDYRPGVTRSMSMQHPMHLHGHKFWVLGSGPGLYNYEVDHDSLNLHNPPLRDTATLLPNSWLYLRFKANNPGIWPLHCHILWHAYMGQKVYFFEATNRITPVPASRPACPRNCLAEFGPYTRSWVNATFGAAASIRDLPS
ncbi:hypothetical protein QJQ45_024447 [Haematococcus lacustris]|nr:hypothetical protein QJQ45_024447 [Haematococcus lacustris]